jgi:leucyl/phenylalanyl-tRNA---protein transferase
MIPLIAPDDPRPFPDVRRALREPNGLLAVGADLSPRRLTSAYRKGIFPWFSEGEPILWWSPDPRTLLDPARLHMGRSLRKRLRQQRLAVSMDRDFGGVIRACAAPRAPGLGTWIMPEMIRAYERLHRLGIAHSIEVWAGTELAGGLYGVAIGRAFFGESMFSRTADASKVALVHLCRQLTDWAFGLIDCQMRTEHLAGLGAVEVPRAIFVDLLDRYCELPGMNGSWNDGQLHFPADRLPGQTGGDPETIS